MTKRLSEIAIVKSLADATAKRISRAAIASLQRLPGVWGQESGPKSTWDEICVQIQFEESAAWDVYDETVKSLIGGMIEDLPTHELEALWLQTDEGSDWDCEDPYDRDDYPVYRGDVVHYLVTAHIYTTAGRWSNPRIRAYLDRAGMTD